MKDYVKNVEELNPDLILVIGWYFMIPEAMRKIPSKGCIGIHGSLLPQYRGGAPLVWAMINGENRTGITLFYFEKGVGVISFGKATAQNHHEHQKRIETVMNSVPILNYFRSKYFVPCIAGKSAVSLLSWPVLTVFVGCFI